MSTTGDVTGRPARARRRSAAVCPIAAASMRTVVSGGVVSAAKSRSPKPTTASCRGADTGDAGLLENTERELVRAAEHRVDAVGPTGPATALRERAAAAAKGRRRRDDDGPRIAQAQCAGRGSEGVAAPARPLVVAAIRPAGAALRVQELRHRAADRLVRETDQHVDRRRREVPGLDDRDARRAGACALRQCRTR